MRPSAWLCFDNQCTKEHRRYYCTRVISYRTARRPGGHVGVGEVVLETCFHFSNKKFVEFFSSFGEFLLKSVTPKTKSCELSSTLFYCRDLRFFLLVLLCTLYGYGTTVPGTRVHILCTLSCTKTRRRRHTKTLM